MEIDLQVLDDILSLRKISHLKNLMSVMVRRHLLSQRELISTSKRDILNLAHRLNERRRALTKPRQSLSETWMWREQKLFVWVVIYYAEAALLDVNALAEHQFQKIVALFPSKKESFLRYEYTLAFQSEATTGSHWQQDEIHLLEQIYAEMEKIGNHWKRISYKLYISSNGQFFKSAENCRNRWENHSDPNLKKSPWSAEEDLQMARCIMKHGTRWAAVAKTACVGRTEHMIKNRYRCLIKKMRINQKSWPVERICEAIIKQSTLTLTQHPKHNHSQIVDQTDAKAEEDISDSTTSIKNFGQFGAEAKAKGLSAAEILEEMRAKEIGEDYRYIAPLDDEWLDRIMEDRCLEEELNDIYCY